jgi:hypothetical protein
MVDNETKLLTTLTGQSELQTVTMLISPQPRTPHPGRCNSFRTREEVVFLFSDWFENDCFRTALGTKRKSYCQTQWIMLGFKKLCFLLSRRRFNFSLCLTAELSNLWMTPHPAFVGYFPEKIFTREFDALAAGIQLPVSA